MFTKQRRVIICFLVAIAVQYLTSEVGFSHSIDTQTLRIVEEGKTLSIIVISDKASDKVKDAVKLLQRYIKESSGADVAVFSEKQLKAEQSAKIRIYVGAGKYVDGLDLRLQSLDGDGYVLRGTADGDFVIVGPTDWGTKFGVYEFLEQYIDIRWLMPGVYGDDVPVHHTIDIPVKEVRDEPVFISREYCGTQEPEVLLWLQRNRNHYRIYFNHHLMYLFPPEKYGKTHPEFFPILDGKRHIPEANDRISWQPCFSADGIVDEAVKNICKYFDEHPEEISYSLGIIDSTKFCQCQRCSSRYPKEDNFLGFPHYSDLYFDWCNQVITRVLEKYPDKWFGVLAYFNVAQPPDHTKIHPRIIPFMTYDRMKWVVPEIRQVGEDFTKKWHKVSPSIGWYDYIYGTPYMLPRVYFHQMADYIKFAQENGVIGLYAEAYPNFGEGPKLYVALKLAWNPNQDVDKLISEWYLRAVGKDAASYLAEYYRIWEVFWTTRALKSKWFTKDKDGIWLGFSNPDYLADVSEEDIIRSRELLEAVVSKAQTKKQRSRAQLLLKAFEYYEASTIAYQGELRAETIKIESAEDALAVLSDGARCLEFAEKRYKLVYQDFINNPVLAHRLHPATYKTIAGLHWGEKLFQLTRKWVNDKDVNKQLQFLAVESKSESVRKHAKAMLQSCK